MSRCEDEQMWEKMWEKMWRWANVKMSRCEDEKMWEKMWRWADVKMSRCEDEQMWEKMWEKMWRWANVKMSRCEDEKMWEKMWRWADVKMSRCERRCERRYEDEQMWRWAFVKMRRCERRYEERWADERRCERRCERRYEDEQMWRWADVKMRRCEDEKVRYRPPLLEEPCAQTLSGKKMKKHRTLRCTTSIHQPINLPGISGVQRSPTSPRYAWYHPCNRAQANSDTKRSQTSRTTAQLSGTCSWRYPISCILYGFVRSYKNFLYSFRKNASVRLESGSSTRFQWTTKEYKRNKQSHRKYWNTYVYIYIYITIHIYILLYYIYLYIISYIQLIYIQNERCWGFKCQNIQKLGRRR